MAKNFIKPRKHETGRTFTTKSPYGTHSDMLVTDETVLKRLHFDEFETVQLVLAKDDEGYYITEKNRVDSGLADPNRYATSMREEMQNKILEAVGDS